MNKEFETAMELYKQRMRFELGYITREIEKNEREHAFLIKKRQSYETSLQDLKQCQKNSMQPSTP